MATTMTFRRRDEFSYTVLVDGVEVGYVVKGWKRVGGECWVAFSDAAEVGSFTTRKAAGRRLKSRAMMGMS